MILLKNQPCGSKIAFLLWLQLPSVKHRATLIFLQPIPKLPGYAVTLTNLSEIVTLKRQFTQNHHHHHNKKSLFAHPMMLSLYGEKQ